MRIYAKLGLGVLAASSLLLAACSSSTSTSSSTTDTSSATTSASASATGDGTVSVDVGNGTPIKLKTGPLKIGVFLQSTANKWNQVTAAAATEEAKKFGYEVTIVTPNWDMNKQLAQAQAAVTNHTFDVVLIQPLAAEQECDMFTKKLPASNVLVGVMGTLCNAGGKTGDELWTPGTLTTVHGDTTISYVRAFFREAIKENPGAHKVAFVGGPDIDPLTVIDKTVIAEFAKTNPEFQVVGTVPGDWTTPTALKKTQAYIAAHPEVDLIMSAYSPDVSRGVVDAVRSANMLGKITIIDQGASEFTVDAIKKGEIQFSLPYFPTTYVTYAIDAVHDAQQGKTVPHWISNIPAEFGTVDSPTAVNKSNVATFTAGY